ATKETGITGIYFPTLLARLGISEAVTPKIVNAGSRMPSELVERGDAEMAVQQISEMLSVPGIEIVGPLPEPLQKNTLYSAGMLTMTQNTRAANELAEFLSTASRPLLTAKGFEAP